MQRSAVRFVQPGPATAPVPVAVLVVDHRHSVRTAHHGYVYSLAMMPFGRKTLLASGAGDGTIRLWDMRGTDLAPHGTLESATPTADAVMSLTAWTGTLLAGRQGGLIEVWDLESLTLVRTIQAHTDDVLCLQAMPSRGGLAFASAGADQHVCLYDRYFRRRARFHAHLDMVQGVAWMPARTTSSYSWLSMAPILVTVSSDEHVRLWQYETPRAVAPDALDLVPAPLATLGPALDVLDQAPAAPCPLIQRLTHFVQYQSVSHPPTASGVQKDLEDCRQAAHFVKSTLMELGASQVQLLSTGQNTNPLVLGTFRAKQARHRCLFYGHYDCVPAGPGWDHSPWQLEGRDGYVYGRGVSDNKGPILAVAYAASQLLHEHALDIDVVMLIEGEQEIGSKSLAAALAQYKPLLGDIDTVLVCNSYWLGEHRPCLTIGLRGLLHATVTLRSQRADEHSGVHGGAQREPMHDMVKLLASLTDNDARVALPHFYDDVRPIGDAEQAWLTSVAQEARQKTHADRLKALWCSPSFTVHQLRTSGDAHSSLISKAVEATLSLRLVPDQDMESLAEMLQRELQARFAAMNSPNELSVEVDYRADWWLGQTESHAWHALLTAVETEWGQTPSVIREGGSIPAMAMLEKALGAKAVHLPMGQASDAAHLPNERIRLLNLEVRQLSNPRKGKRSCAASLLRWAAHRPRRDHDLPSLFTRTRSPPALSARSWRWPGATDGGGAAAPRARSHGAAADPIHARRSVCSCSGFPPPGTRVHTRRYFRG